jgi:hypothetical protein
LLDGSPIRWPWLATAPDSGNFARAWGIAEIGPNEVARALGGQIAGDDPARTVEAPCMPAAYRWLAGQADRLTQRTLEQLKTAPAARITKEPGFRKARKNPDFLKALGPSQ